VGISILIKNILFLIGVTISYLGW